MTPLDHARDTAQAAVTAALTYDRELAAQIVQESSDDPVLPLVLVDLVAYVHHRWCRVFGFDDAQRLEAWSELMLDIAEWRGTR